MPLGSIGSVCICTLDIFYDLVNFFFCSSINGTIIISYSYSYMPKKTKTEVIKQATKKVQDNPYLKDFLKEYEEETGLKTRFTAKKDKFLSYLVSHNGFISHAAKEMGFFPASVRFAMKGDPAFAQAVQSIREGFVAERLDGLEKTSFEQAAKPGNITERIFQLKAHDPAKYRDRVNQQNTQVNVVVSGTSPKDRASILKTMKIN